MEAVREESVESLVRKHFNRVYNFCRTLLGNEADVEDACQEVFLTVSRRRADLAQVVQPVPWLLQIARLVCLYARRRRARHAAGEATEEESSVTADEALPIPATENLALIRRAVERLPERYRTVLALHYQQNLSHEEMARTLEISRGTLRVLLHRAILRLRKEVRES